MAGAVVGAPSEILRDEVIEFLEAARRRSESDSEQRRRSVRRYHRSWPLRAICDGVERSAALHNASETGLAFLSQMSLPTEAVLFVKLFCHANDRPWVPAVIRHATATEHGYLIGCEFAIDNPELCADALSREG